MQVHYQDTDDEPMPDGEQRVLLASHDTGGSFALVTLTLPPFCAGDAPHSHPAHAEGWYVLGGSLAVTVGDHTLMLRVGETALVPPGVLHTCWNPTATTTTVLQIAIPGRDEDELLGLGQPAQTAAPGPDNAPLAPRF